MKSVCETCEKHTTHRDDSMNLRCNGCEYLIWQCICRGSVCSCEECQARQPELYSERQRMDLATARFEDYEGDPNA